MESKERTLLQTVLYYLSILFRYRLLIILCTALVTLGAVGYCVLTIMLPPDRSPLPNVYAATAVILLKPNAQKDLAANLLASMGIEATGPYPGYDMGELVLLVSSSRPVIDRVVEQLNIVSRYRFPAGATSKARDLVLKKLRLSYARITGAITISFADTDPSFSSAVVNGIVEALDAWFSANRGSAQAREKLSLEEKLTQVKKDIADLEERLKGLQKKYGVINAQDLGTSRATTLTALRTRLIQKELEIQNYSASSKIDEARFQQLKNERQDILDLINGIQGGVSDSSENGEQQKNLPDVAQEFAQITLQLDVQRKIYNTLSPAYEAAKLSTESESVFDVLEKAEVPETKTGPQRSRIIELAFVAALAGSVALALLLNAIDKARRDPETRAFLMGKK